MRRGTIFHDIRRGGPITPQQQIGNRRRNGLAGSGLESRVAHLQV
jgi:hypothetical protein